VLAKGGELIYVGGTEQGIGPSFVQGARRSAKRQG
jgi:adenylosuccinate synthase